MFDEAFRVRAQALEDGYEGAERGRGDHVVGILTGLQEDRHDDARHLGRTVGVRAERPADVLDDLDLGAAGVGEADRLDPLVPTMSTPSPRTRTLARNAR